MSAFREWADADLEAEETRLEKLLNSDNEPRVQGIAKFLGALDAELSRRVGLALDGEHHRYDALAAVAAVIDPRAFAPPCSSNLLARLLGRMDEQRARAMILAERSIAAFTSLRSNPAEAPSQQQGDESRG